MSIYWFITFLYVCLCECENGDFDYQDEKYAVGEKLVVLEKHDYKDRLKARNRNFE